ncbi:ADP-ribosyltransferase [Streptococcus orisasini]
MSENKNRRSFELNNQNRLYELASAFQLGKKWDKLSPTVDNVKEFTLEKLNTEPPKNLNGDPNKSSSEYCLAYNCGERYNYRIRDRDSDDDFNDKIKRYSDEIKKYSIKENVVVYRGISKLVKNQIEEAAKEIDGVDLYDRAFLNTSLVKGYEKNSQFKLRVFLPKGTCAFYVGSITGEDFYEVIVQKGAKLKIVSKDSDYINCILLGTD